MPRADDVDAEHRRLGATDAVRQRGIEDARRALGAEAKRLDAAWAHELMLRGYPSDLAARPAGWKPGAGAAKDPKRVERGRKSYHGDSCEPCGGCRWCKENFKAKRDRIELRKWKRQALKHLDDLCWAIRAELAAAGPDEIRGNPTLQKRQRLLDRVDRFLPASKSKSKLK